MSSCSCKDNCNCNPETPVFQTLIQKPETGDLTITPYGNTLNLQQLVKNAETKTKLVGLRVVGANTSTPILEVSYLGEDGVTQFLTTQLPNGSLSETSFTAISSNSLAFTTSGTSNHTLTGSVKIDPASTASISSSLAGLKIDFNETPLSIYPTDTTILVSSGPSSHTLGVNVKFFSTGSIQLASNTSGLYANVKLSSNVGNILNFGSDGGLYATASSGPSISETTTTLINTISGHRIGTYNNEIATSVDINETVTSLGVVSYNSTTGILDIPYTDENGIITTRSVTIPTEIATTISGLLVSGNVIGTYTNEIGTPYIIRETNTILSGTQATGKIIGTHTSENNTVVNIRETITDIDLTVAGNTIARYTKEDGTTVLINETVTSLSSAGVVPHSLTYTDEAGSVIPVDIGLKVLDAIKDATLVPSGTIVNVLGLNATNAVVKGSASASETTTTITGVQGTGKIIGVHTNEIGTIVNIRETITDITGPLAVGHTIGTYVKEDGTTVILRESVSTLALSPVAHNLRFTDENGTLNDINLCTTVTQSLVDTTCVPVSTLANSIYVEEAAGVRKITPCNLSNITYSTVDPGGAAQMTRIYGRLADNTTCAYKPVVFPTLTGYTPSPIVPAYSNGATLINLTVTNTSTGATKVLPINKFFTSGANLTTYLNNLGMTNSYDTFVSMSVRDHSCSSYNSSFKYINTNNLYLKRILYDDGSVNGVFVNLPITTILSDVANLTLQLTGLIPSTSFTVSLLGTDINYTYITSTGNKIKYFVLSDSLGNNEQLIYVNSECVTSTTAYTFTAGATTTLYSGNVIQNSTGALSFTPLIENSDSSFTINGVQVSSNCCPKSVTILDKSSTAVPVECPDSYFPAIIYEPDGLTIIRKVNNIDELIFTLNNSSEWKTRAGVAVKDTNCKVTFIGTQEQIPTLYVENATIAKITDVSINVQNPRFLLSQSTNSSCPTITKRIFKITYATLQGNEAIYSFDALGILPAGISTTVIGSDLRVNISNWALFAPNLIDWDNSKSLKIDQEVTDSCGFISTTSLTGLKDNQTIEHYSFYGIGFITLDHHSSTTNTVDNEGIAVFDAYTGAQLGEFSGTDINHRQWSGVKVGNYLYVYDAEDSTATTPASYNKWDISNPLSPIKKWGVVQNGAASNVGTQLITDGYYIYGTRDFGEFTRINPTTGVQANYLGKPDSFRVFTYMNGFIYAIGHTNGIIYRIDPNDFTSSAYASGATIAPAFSGETMITNDGTYVYVYWNNGGIGTLSKVDPNSLQILQSGTIPTAVSTFSSNKLRQITHFDGKVYTPKHFESGPSYAFNTKTMTSTALTTGNLAGAYVFVPINDGYYVVTADNGSFEINKRITDTIVQSFSLPGFDSMFVTPVRTLGYPSTLV